MPEFYLGNSCCRIARHGSANLSMELFRVPEDRMQQNIDFLEKIIEKTHDDSEIATAVADILPQEHIGEYCLTRLTMAAILKLENAF